MKMKIVALPAAVYFDFSAAAAVDVTFFALPLLAVSSTLMPASVPWIRGINPDDGSNWNESYAWVYYSHGAFHC